MFEITLEVLKRIQENVEFSLTSPIETLLDKAGPDNAKKVAQLLLNIILVSRDKPAEAILHAVNDTEIRSAVRGIYACLYPETPKDARQIVIAATDQHYETECVRRAVHISALTLIRNWSEELLTKKGEAHEYAGTANFKAIQQLLENTSTEDRDERAKRLGTAQARQPLPVIHPRLSREEPRVQPTLIPTGRADVPFRRYPLQSPAPQRQAVSIFGRHPIHAPNRLREQPPAQRRQRHVETPQLPPAPPPSATNTPDPTLFPPRVPVRRLEPIAAQQPAEKFRVFCVGSNASVFVGDLLQGYEGRGRRGGARGFIGPNFVILPSRTIFEIDCFSHSSSIGKMKLRHANNRNDIVLVCEEYSANASGVAGQVVDIAPGCNVVIVSRFGGQYRQGDQLIQSPQFNREGVSTFFESIMQMIAARPEAMRMRL